jgi:hypothetical protein
MKTLVVGERSQSTELKVTVKKVQYEFIKRYD